MPRKIPVAATAGAAYAFIGREWPAILRLTWFPLLIVAAIRFAAIYLATPTPVTLAQIEALRGKPPYFASIANFSAFEVGGIIVTLCASAMAAAALHRLLLFGDRKPGHFIHFELGRVELLFALLPILGGALILVINVLVLFLIYAQHGALAFLIIAPGVVAIAFSGARLSVIFPVTVVRRRLAFAETWRLTRGNFWRMVGAGILANLPLLLVMFIVQFVFLAAVVGSLGGTTSDSALTAAAFERFRTIGLIGVALSYPASIFFAALTVGLLGNFYKALTGVPADQTVDPNRPEEPYSG